MASNDTVGFSTGEPSPATPLGSENAHPFFGPLLNPLTSAEENQPALTEEQLFPRIPRQRLLPWPSQDLYNRRIDGFMITPMPRNPIATLNGPWLLTALGRRCLDESGLIDEENYIPTTESLPLPNEKYFKPCHRMPEKLEEFHQIVEFFAQAEFAVRILLHPDQSLGPLLEPVAVADWTRERRLVGEQPPISSVKEIHRKAIDCSRFRVSAQKWNYVVNRRLLVAASDTCAGYMTSDEWEISVVDVPYTFDSNDAETFEICSTNVVDFCLCITPLSDNILPGISKRTTSSFHKSSTFVDAKFIDFPFAVCIKTKATHETWPDALTTMSNWFDDQWTKLNQLAQKNGTLLPDDPNVFLPGIIIDRDKWYFVAATRGRASPGSPFKTFIWSSCFLGSTIGLGSTYNLITEIQLMVRWSRWVYCRWTNRVLFGEGEDTPGPQPTNNDGNLVFHLCFKALFLPEE